MPGEPLYHLALRGDWEADPARPYAMSTIGRTLDEEGFIHCSFRAQVRQTADRYYAGRDDVVVLTIDPTRVDTPIRVESVGRGTEQFPHLYGPLPRDAVVAVTPLESFDGA
jgi:uncharacterized protein (DUF952 family)